MSAEVQRITSFYEAFQRRDGEGMAACYHPDVRFGDPVFPELRGERAAGMWRMFCATPDSDLRIEFSGVSYDGGVGRAHWEAWYTFRLTGRPVHNVIDATFRFADDGRILEHTDVFDFWRWSRQALGTQGLLLGWTPIVRNAVRKAAGQQLDKFLAKGAGG